MVAFLLITAVWTDVARIDVAPGGKSDRATDEEPRAVSVLVGSDAHWVGARGRPAIRIDRRADGYDYTGLAEALRDLSHAGLLDEATPVEVAAEDRVAYQDVVSTLDTAIGLGRQVAWAEPGTLSVRFTH